MLRIALLAPLALLAGCAMTPEQSASLAASDARDQARLDKKLAGYVPGAPKSCIQRNRTSEMSIFGDTLVYRDGRTLYRTQTSGGCFGLKRDDIVVTKSFGSSICSGDLVRTVDRTNAFPSGSCSFGDFVPYTKPRAG